jgi:hypothetical protein
MTILKNNNGHIRIVILYIFVCSIILPHLNISYLKSQEISKNYRICYILEYNFYLIVDNIITGQG